LLAIQLVGWKTRDAIFHAGQEGNPDNSTPPRVDGFGHPPYVRLGIASKLAPTGCGICRALGFCRYKKGELISSPFLFAM